MSAVIVDESATSAEQGVIEVSRPENVAPLDREQKELALREPTP